MLFVLFCYLRNLVYHDQEHTAVNFFREVTDSPNEPLSQLWEDCLSGWLFFGSIICWGMFVCCFNWEKSTGYPFIVSYPIHFFLISLIVFRSFILWVYLLFPFLTFSVQRMLYISVLLQHQVSKALIFFLSTMSILNFWNASY